MQIFGDAVQVTARQEPITIILIPVETEAVVISTPLHYAKELQTFLTLNSKPSFSVLGC